MRRVVPVPVGFGRLRLCPVFEPGKVMAAGTVDLVTANREDSKPDLARCPNKGGGMRVMGVPTRRQLVFSIGSRYRHLTDRHPV